MKIVQLLKKIYKLSLFAFLAIIIVILALYAYSYFSPPVELITNDSYYMYDINEELIFDNTSNKEWIELDEISPNFINAILSIEDKNFYYHLGFDYGRIIKALLNNIKNGKIIEGASTISQQYIKNAYLTLDKTWSRKIKEAMMTLNLEVHYTKDEILEAYLNTINFGQGNYGIASASAYYFNKKPAELTLEEAIVLAGIPKSPNNYNPISNYDESIKRARIVAVTMYNNSYITAEESTKLFKNKLNLYGNKYQNNMTMLMYYQDAVLKELKNEIKISVDLLNSGNLKVYTELDLDIQSFMEKTIKDNIIDKNLQVASAIINPRNGAIMALTGGLDYSKSQYNRALSSKRQVGSTMKPFLYYAALENGMTESSTFTSQQTTFTFENGKTYSPQNWANIYGNKDITMAAAIAYSDNIYAVKTNLFLGVDKLLETAKKCGINAQLDPVPSLALGTSEINLLDFAKGYTTFASGGYERNLHFISKITDLEGNIIYEYKEKNNLVLNPNYVYILNEMLTSPANSAFIDYNTPTALGIASKLSTKYSLKSGTTDTDYWTVGYNQDVLAIMWTGYDDNANIELNVGTNSKNIWANIIDYSAQKHKTENSWYTLPNNVVGLPLDAITGLPTENTAKVNMFYYLKGSEPNYQIENYKKEES